MTLDMFIRVLRAHQAALSSTSWPQPHGTSNGPALYLDGEDTQALIEQLTKAREELAARTSSSTGRHTATPPDSLPRSRTSA